MVAYLEVPELSKGAIASIKAANLLSIVTHRGEKQKQQKNKNAPHIQKKKTKQSKEKAKAEAEITIVVICCCLVERRIQKCPQHPCKSNNSIQRKTIQKGQTTKTKQAKKK